jgi:hypothetical protein
VSIYSLWSSIWRIEVTHAVIDILRLYLRFLRYGNLLCLPVNLGQTQGSLALQRLVFVPAMVISSLTLSKLKAVFFSHKLSNNLMIFSTTGHKFFLTMIDSTFVFS